MLVTLSGIVRVVKPSQRENAFSPILVTLSGIVRVVKLWQLLNALLLIFVTLFGIVMLVRPVQWENAELLIFVTLSGIVIPVKPEQRENASSPMLVTLSGIVIPVKPVQPENAERPILVTPSLIITLLILFLFHSNEEFYISPVPEIVKTPLLSRVYVRLSPHAPLSTNISPQTSQILSPLVSLCPVAGELTCISPLYPFSCLAQYPQ